MDQISEMKLRILDLLPQGEVILVVGELVSGEVDSNVTYIICTETGGKWEFIGRGITTAEEEKKGLRWIELKYIEGSRELKEGFTLVST